MTYEEAIAAKAAVEFQFLIGKVQHLVRPEIFEIFKEFQFLIGKVQRYTKL